MLTQQEKYPNAKQTQLYLAKRLDFKMFLKFFIFLQSFIFSSRESGPALFDERFSVLENTAS